MNGEQHRITPDTMITEAMSDGAAGGFLTDALGKQLDLVYEIPDSDRREILLRFVDGPVLMISCDPGYDADGVHRTPDQWESFVYDVSDVEAGKKARNLDSGRWF